MKKLAAVKQDVKVWNKKAFRNIDSKCLTLKFQIEQLDSKGFDDWSEDKQNKRLNKKITGGVTIEKEMMIRQSLNLFLNYIP